MHKKKMDIKKIRTNQATTLLEAAEIHQHIVSSIMNSVDNKSVIEEAKRFRQYLDRYWKQILERRMKGSSSDSGTIQSKILLRYLIFKGIVICGNIIWVYQMKIFLV